MVARKLVYEIVARYGAFCEFHSNQGTNFGSKVVAEVCQLFGIHKTRTTPYHPRSEGFIERSFRTLGRCLKAACRETRRELPGYASRQYVGHPEYDDAGPANTAAAPGYLRRTAGTG